jgi:hypothetical protein
MAERTPTAEQQAQLKRQSEQLAALDAEEKKIFSEDYQKTLTPQQYDQAAARLDELYAQRSQLSRSQSELAAQAYGVDPNALKKGESVTFTTKDGVKVNIGGTGVPSQNTAARSNYAADDYEADQIRSETAGPRVTRTDTTTTTRITGGNQRVTEMTPDMKSWTEKNSQANKLDEAAQRDAFLRSQGLENADKATQLKAITKARNQYDADGNSTFDKYKSTSNRDSVGPPPKEQYKTTEIAANKTGTQKVNDGEMSADTASKQSAAGQTADQAVKDAITPDPATPPLTAEQKAKLDKDKTGELSAEVNQSQDPNAASKQNATGGAGVVKSESDFVEGAVTNQNNSVSGTNASGNSSSRVEAEIRGLERQNILHNFASYTYRITLFFLTSKDYNQLCASPKTFVPKYSLISSSGGFNTTMYDLVAEETRTGSANYNVTTRHPDFQTDFFIDNLSIDTVVGLNAKTKASNAVGIGFTITEPYGLSLLDRLLSACETSEDAATNYMTQPYLLQVDLLSNPSDEETAGQLANNVIVSKKIAIKLIEMKIKPTGSGTTYAVRAIPYNHAAFEITTASLPVPINVVASTVGEFFSGENNEETVKLFSDQVKAEEERIESEIQKITSNRPDTYFWVNRKPTEEQIANERRALKQGIIYSVKNLAAAYNTYMESIAKQKKLANQVPVKIAFNIPDDIIAKALIVNEFDSSTTDTGMKSTDTAVNKPDSTGFKKKQNFTLREGTSIIEVIDMVVTRSEYIKKQLKNRGTQQNQTDAANEYNGNTNRSETQTSSEQLNWFKIVPTVVLNDFDGSTNNYSKTVLYSVLPYVAANTYHPNFAQINSSNVKDFTVRTYNYLYTGLNQDIIKLDIDFDTSFYTLITTKGEQVERVATHADTDFEDIDKKKDTYQQTGNNTNNPPVTKAFSGSNKQSVATSKASDPDEQVIADLKTSIYTRQRGDALNIKLQIIGDPAFIKQDDIFYNPGSPDEYADFISNRTSNNSKTPIGQNGQILFDAEQVYIELNVKNAIDINDSIGIVNKQDILMNGRTTNGTFSGIYKVLTVSSQFSRGQFTQTLDLVRIPDALNPPSAPVMNSNRIINNPSASSDAEAKLNIFARPVIPSNPPIAASAPIEPPPIVANQPSDVGSTNTPLTFDQAFAQARRDFGNRPGGVFEWRGKLYQTNIRGEDFVSNPTPVYPGANE